LSPPHAMIYYFYTIYKQICQTIYNVIFR
jgi:hypothetical protein